MPNTMRVTETTNADDYIKAVRKALESRPLIDSARLRLNYSPSAEELRLCYDSEPGDAYEWGWNETFMRIERINYSDRLETRAELYDRLASRVHAFILDSEHTTLARLERKLVTSG